MGVHIELWAIVVFEYFRKAELPKRRKIGIYMFRYLFAERMEDHIQIERLATIMRTSVKMLEQVYGIHDETSYGPVINDAVSVCLG